MSVDQKRALVILAFIVVLVAAVVIGVVWLALAIGLPAWAAIVLAVVLAAGLGLFMFLNLA
jgi:membrane protein YdbS with pleckstrin-like domain